MNPLELQKFNLQAINQEGDSAHSLRYNKMEEYSPDYSKENSLIVSKINIKKKLQFEDLNEKEPNLFLEDITNTNNNYPSMDLTGRTGIL